MTLKEKTTALLDFLSDKTLSLGCVIKYGDIPFNRTILGIRVYANGVNHYYLDDDNMIREKQIDKTIGHPVMLHDVLAKKDYLFWWDNYTDGGIDRLCHLYFLWNGCGIKRSLNDIFQLSAQDCIKSLQDGSMYHKRLYFKDENSKNLFDFLWDIFGSGIQINNKKLTEEIKRVQDNKRNEEQ